MQFSHAIAVLNGDSFSTFLTPRPDVSLFTHYLQAGHFWSRLEPEQDVTCCAGGHLGKLWLCEISWFLSMTIRSFVLRLATRLFVQRPTDGRTSADADVSLLSRGVFSLALFPHCPQPWD